MPGADEVVVKLKAAEKRKLAGAYALCGIYAGRLEAQAKQNAPWTDRTGNARKFLKGSVSIDEKAITIYLSHSVEYGIWLELANSGKYAILKPTMESRAEEIKKGLQDYWNG